MTLDEFIRWVCIPAIGTAALFALVVTLREEWRDWKDGERW